MRHAAFSAVSITILLALVACGPAPVEPEATETPSPEPAAAGSAPGDVPAEALQKARQAADALTSELISTLGQELRAGGPVGAVKVCAEKAPEIAARHSVDGVFVRRVTLKVRNPQDTPDDYERGVLQDLEAKHAGGALPKEVAEVVDDETGSKLRYLRPLVIKSPCLNCHGSVESMDPELRTLLRERYPDDEAVGYEMGDLRGAVSVTVDLS